LEEDRPDVCLHSDAEATVADAQSVLSDLFRLAFPPLALWHIGQLRPDQLLSTIPDNVPVAIRPKQFQPNEVRFAFPDKTEMECLSESTKKTEGLMGLVSQWVPAPGGLICHGKVVLSGAELWTFYSISDVFAST
jgi:hypothetical protein